MTAKRRYYAMERDRDGIQLTVYAFASKVDREKWRSESPASLPSEPGYRRNLRAHSSVVRYALRSVSSPSLPTARCDDCGASREWDAAGHWERWLDAHKCDLSASQREGERDNDDDVTSLALCR